MRIRYYLRVLKTIVSVNVQVMMAYRAQFLMLMFSNMVFFASHLLVLSLMFANASEVAGWSRYEMICMGGVGQVVFYGFFSLFDASLSTLDEDVGKGTLDHLLLLPLNTRFYMSLFRMDVFRFLPLATGFGVTAYALGKLGRAPDLFSVLFFLLLICVSVAILYNIFVIFITFSFKLVRLSFLPMLFFILTGTLVYPIDVFPGVWQKIILFAVPIGVVTDFPTRWLLKGMHDWRLYYFLALPLLLHFVSGRVFRWGISQYRSAGG